MLEYISVGLVFTILGGVIGVATFYMNSKKNTKQETKEEVSSITKIDTKLDIIGKNVDEIRLDKKIEGIAEVRDETDKEGLRIAIDLKKDANSELILNYLFK